MAKQGSMQPNVNNLRFIYLLLLKEMCYFIKKFCVVSSYTNILLEYIRYLKIQLPE